MELNSEGKCSLTKLVLSRQNKCELKNPNCQTGKGCVISKMKKGQDGIRNWEAGAEPKLKHHTEYQSLVITGISEHRLHTTQCD